MNLYILWENHTYLKGGKFVGIRPKPTPHKNSNELANSQNMNELFMR